MTALVLTFASDSFGRLVDPATGRCWDCEEDRKFFRETIAGKSIICGRETFEQDWRGLKAANSITVITSGYAGDKLRKILRERGIPAKVGVRAGAANTVLGALLRAKVMAAGEDNEIFCVGGKKTIEAFAPFASQVLLTQIGTVSGSYTGLTSLGDKTLPAEIKEQLSLGLWNYKSLRRSCEGKWTRIRLRRERPIEL